MAIAIQDQRKSATYLITNEELDQLAPVNAAETAADIVFVIPSESLIQRAADYPALSGGTSTESVMIIDSDTDRAWYFTREELQRFITTEESFTNDAEVWFAIPDGENIISATPLFRRALEQYGSR